ncbi:hypothetical protein GCM10027299_31860 [Larkinella ripae]
MERSTRFTSLSGLSGIVVGLLALAGVEVVNWKLNREHLTYQAVYQGALSPETSTFLLIVTAVVLMLALCSVLILSRFKAQKANQPLWQQAGQRMFSNLCIPLAAGGVFCLVLLYHQIFYLVAPSMLIFYGLAMIQSSKYTFPEIRYLGLGEMALGLLACFRVEYGLLAWGAGFGGLNMLYGALIVYKYERK